MTSNNHTLNCGFWQEDNEANLNWEDAVEACKENHNAELVIIRSLPEMFFLMENFNTDHDNPRGR